MSIQGSARVGTSDLQPGDAVLYKGQTATVSDRACENCAQYGGIVVVFSPHDIERHLLPSDLTRVSS